MSDPKKRFETYEPTEAQAVKIEEVNSAYRFVNVLLQRIRPPKDYPLALDYWSQAVRTLEDSVIKARMAVIYNDAIQKVETEEGKE